MTHIILNDGVAAGVYIITRGVSFPPQNFGGVTFFPNPGAVRTPKKIIND